MVAGKWTLNEDVGILLKMGIFQPAILGNTGGYSKVLLSPKET